MRRLAALLALIVIALLTWLVVMDDGGAPEMAPERDAAPQGTQRNDPDTSGALASEQSKPPRVREHAVLPTPGDEPSQDAEATTYTVRVVDQHDRPVPGVVVHMRTSLGVTSSHRTRSDGRASWGVAYENPEITATSPLFDEVELHETETVVRLDDLLPLQIRFVDQESGRPVGVWIQGSPLETDDVLSNQQVTTYEPHAAPIRAGRSADLKLWFGAPDGYALVKRRGGWGYAVSRTGFISRYATSVRTTVPVTRELRLRVRVLRHDGTPAAGARATVTVTGEHAENESVFVDATGAARITGLPFLRGEQVQVHASDADGRCSSAVTSLVAADREHEVTVRLPEHVEDSVIGIGGGASGRFSDRTGTRRQPEGTGRLTVSLTRRNGLPAAGAFVLVYGPVRHTRHADESGCVELDRLPAGKYTITLREPGLVCTSREVVLEDGAAQTIALRESAGRAATVRVLDARGLPLPNVLVHVDLPWGERHVEMTDGVQKLGSYTDVSGRVAFTDLPEGTLVAVAILGSRRINAPLLAEGESLITIPDR